MIPSHQESVAGEAQVPPSEGEICAQLDRIRSSDEFDVPERARKFLCYVAHETIEGRADRIKAYTIGVEVFGRDASFDAQSDPVVRIEAGRVRRALERYYLVAGQDDPIIITMPKGGYVPVFVRATRLARPDENASSGDEEQSYPKPSRGKRIWPVAAGLALLLAGLAGTALYLHSAQIGGRAEDTKTTGRPAPHTSRLLVRGFEDLSGTELSSNLARGLTDEVIGQIAKFKEVSVVVSETRDRNGLDKSGNPEVPAYALEGSVRISDGKLRLSTRLVNRADRSVVWADNYDEDLKVRDLLDLEGEVARAVATSLAQPYGIIFSADATRVSQPPPEDWEAYACTLSYYGYRTDLNPQTHGTVQSCLKQAVARFPNYATAWALLSLTYLDELRFRYRLKSASQPSIDLAVGAAERAVALDPQNIRALQAQMLALYFRGSVDSALAIGARAFQLNPNDTELTGEYGFRLALSGQWKLGCGLVSDAISRSPGPHGYYEAALAVCAYIDGDYETAEQRARISDLQDNPVYHLILAAILGQRGKLAEAQSERRWFENNAPQFLENLPRELGLRLHRTQDRQHFIAGLTEAGFPIRN